MTPENKTLLKEPQVRKVRYLPWLVVSFLLILIVLKISEWRVEIVKNRLQEQYLLETSDFVNAIDSKFFSVLQSAESDFNENSLERYIHQINSYQIHHPELQIFGLIISENKPIVAITPSIGNPAYKINETFIDYGDFLSEALSLSKPVISEQISKPHGNVISVLIPILSPVNGDVVFVIGFDYPAADYIDLIKLAKRHSYFYTIGIIILIMTTISLILWRDRQILSKRKKLRHIETIAVFIIGILLTIAAVFLSNEYAEKEKKSDFLMLSSQQSSVIRSDFWKIRSSLDVFSNFYSNSEFVDSAEFVSFASQLIDDNSIQSFLWFEGDDVILNENTESKKQLFFVNSRSFNLKYIHNSFIDIPVSEILSNSNESLQNTAATSFANGMINATKTIYVDSIDKTSSYILVMIAASSKNQVPESIESKQTGFLAAIINPQSLFNLSFNKNQWIGEKINIGLIEMNMKNEQNWLASFPEDHIQLHQKHEISEHLKDTRYQQVMPIFAFGRAYRIVTHTTKEFEDSFGYLRGIIIGVSGLIFTIILALMILIWRNRWYGMEKLVDQRTAELRRGITVLTYLKTIGEEMQENQSEKSLLTKINVFLSAAFENNRDLRISIHYENENFGNPSKSDDKKTVLQIPLLLFGQTVGRITVEANEVGYLNSQDEQMIGQVGLMLNRWLEHQAVSDSLKESEEKFRNLIESAFDSIYILEGKHFTYVNKAFVNLIGYSKEELTDPDFDLDVLLTEKSLELVKSRMEARNNNQQIEPRYEFQQLTKAGEIKDVEVSTVSIIHGGQRRILGILRDITERKKVEKALIESEERLQQQNEELQVLNEELIVSNSQIKDMNLDLIAAREKAEASDNLKTAFLNNISHEVRTPLNGILGATIIMAEPDITSEEKAEMSHIVEKSSQRLIRTITQYMDISLLNSGNMPVILNNVDLLPTLKKLCDEISTECKNSNLDFLVTIPPDIEELIVYADKSLIEKVLYHLLENAVKFTKKGTIEFKLKLKNNTVEFEISDSGIGIDKEFHANVFGYFSQEDSSNLRLHDGSGLGLAICKKICDLIGAKIWFQSEKRQGTKFFVELPHQTQSNESTLSIGVDNSLKNSSNPLILIAEDEESNFIVLSMLLQKKLNARIIRAVNGREAVDLFNANPDLQLILMDIKMPVMDGFEATRLIKLEKPDIPIVAITAYGLSGDEYKSLNAGCDDYIAKPVNTKDLIQKVKSYLNV